jgi:hypothetical protein
MNNTRMTLLQRILVLTALFPPSATGEERHFATHSVHELEQAYVHDCTFVDTTPHGYYGAFLQPCEFQFRQQTIKDYGSSVDVGDPCSDEVSTLVSTPVPMHWFFNTTFFIIDQDDGSSWDKTMMMSRDEEILLWPDQCVGVTPRCYAVDNEAIHETLTRIFSKNHGPIIPEGATHVRVDCRGDAVALTRVVYAMAEGLEKSVVMLIAWLVTAMLLSLMLGTCCLCACLRLCCFAGAHPRTTKTSHAFRRSGYEAIENAEKEIMLTKLTHCPGN